MIKGFLSYIFNNLVGYFVINDIHYPLEYCSQKDNYQHLQKYV